MKTATGWRLLVLLSFAALAGAQQAHAVSATATGGYTSTNYTQGGTNFTAYSFTTNGTFTVTSPGNVEVLVVAGGGGGGSRHGGGGGAGGLVYTSSFYVAAASVPVTVGGGGAGNLNSGSSSPGSPGKDSVFSNLVAYGGGYGSGLNGGGPGGSGGGGGYAGSAGGSATDGQGYAGGNGAGDYAGGGGGGAGGVGVSGNGSGPNGKDGGPGVTLYITGSAVTYAAGGGGGSWDGSASGAGGSGIGGNGARGGGSTLATVGPDGTGSGGGGGGGGDSRGYGANGGSGIVIVRYVTTSLLIVNSGATNILATSADLVGNLLAGAAPVSVTCYWGTNDGGQVAGAWMTNTPMGASVPTGYITNSIASGLLPGTVYYFRYYATNSEGDCWAGSTAFCTVGDPMVNNAGGAAPVHQRSATLNGTLVAGNPAPMVWIYWGTGDGGTTKGAWNGGVLNLGTKAFGSSLVTNLSGLLPNTLYWYRCYASNVNNDAWAPASTNFTTQGQPPPFTIAADGDRALNAGANLVADSAVQTITPSGSNPYLYDWHNSNGGGDSAGDGLAMGNSKITTTDGSSIALKMDNVNGNGAITGASPSVAFYTYHGAARSGSIAISNASSISIGGIDTHCDSAGGGGGGAITIGGAGSPIAGNVRIDSICTDVRNYGNGNSGAAGGAVTIFGNGDVKIQTSGGTPGNIDAHSIFSAGGSVNMQHHGSFVANDVDTRAHVGDKWFYESSGSATFNGAFGGSAAGSFQANSINTTQPRGGGGGVAGAISIQGYTAVTVAAGLFATNNYDAAGNISITNITADITINGPIRASGTTMGTLTLQAGGSIALTNLDLSQVQYALLQAGGVCWLNGVLTGTNGLAAAGLSNIGTSLRVPAGKEVRYWRKSNPALGGQKVILADESGAAGAGGRLVPWPASGTSVFFR